jgi:hypothetical protein
MAMTIATGNYSTEAEGNAGVVTTTSLLLGPP